MLHANDKGQLDITAPKGVLTDEIIEHIRGRKRELILYLQQIKTYAEGESIPQAPQALSYALSSSQMRLWLIDKITRGAVAYNIPATIQLSGSFDPAILERAIEAVIQRHEILRTIFLEEDGMVRQKILDVSELDFNMPYFDLRAVPGRDEIVAGHIDADARKVFDLGRPPLVRAMLFRTAEEQYSFYYNMHHIISDGWSMEVLGKEVLGYYDAFSNNKSYELAPLRIQYKDYACWQQKQLQDPLSVIHRDYWLQHLSGVLPVLTLPTQSGRPPVLTDNGYGLSTMINASLTRGLWELCREENATLFMGLLSVLNALFYRYTGEEDIIIGSPIAGRMHPELDNQIGFYINTLALRARFSGNDSFRDLLAKVREVTLSAYEHQSYPFDELVGELHMARDVSRSPVFDVLIDMHNTGMNPAGRPIPDEDTVVVNSKGPRSSKFDLTFIFGEKEDCLCLDVEYNQDLYSKEMICGLIQHYKKLLQSILVNPGKQICRLPFLSAAERHQLLERSGSTAVPLPSGKTILDLFYAQVENVPDHTAVIFRDEQLSYRELDNRSNQVAHYLCKKGVRKGSVVPICLDRSADLLVYILGILKAGGAYVPIDPLYPAERISLLLSDLNADIIVTETYYQDLLSVHSGMIRVYVDRDWIAVTLEPVSVPDLRPEGKDLAYVIYTSGSTGIPKGVEIEHGSLLTYMQWAIDRYLPEPGTGNMGLYSSISFDLTVTSLFGSLLKGKTLHVFGSDIDVTEQLRLYMDEASGLDLIKLTPAHIDVLGTLGLKGTGIRKVIVGGDELHNHHVSILKGLNEAITIYNEYGPTEATVGCIVAEVMGAEEKITIGRPVPPAEVYILDDHQQLQPAGVYGEICIGGAQLARGYRGRPELTADRFIAHPFKEGSRLYRTGDLGRWLPDGNIEYGGRTDDQVKIRGYRVEPGEVTHALLSLPGISSGVVIPRKSDEGAVMLAAYYVSGLQLDSVLLRRQLQQHLPDYMIPVYFVQLAELPLTANGKVDRNALPQPDTISMSGRVAYVPPHNEMEAKLVVLAASVLGKDPEKVGAEDNFFDMGASSLTLIKMIGQINKEFNTDLKVISLFQYPNIKSLACNCLGLDNSYELLQPDTIGNEANLDDVLSLFEE